MLEEQKPCGQLISRLNYHSCNPEAKKYNCSPSLPTPQPQLSCILEAVTGHWHVESSYWGSNDLCCQQRHLIGRMYIASRTLASKKSRNVIFNFPAFTRMGWEWKLLPITSAWEAGWLILPGHPEVFRNEEGKIMTLGYRKPIKWMYHLHSHKLRAKMWRSALRLRVV